MRRSEARGLFQHPSHSLAAGRGMFCPERRQFREYAAPVGRIVNAADVLPLCECPKWHRLTGLHQLVERLHLRARQTPPR